MSAESLVNADGSLTPTKRLLDNLNTGFTAIFTVELLANMFSHWFTDFFSNSWSALAIPYRQCTTVSKGVLSVILACQRLFAPTAGTRPPSRARSYCSFGHA